jgi:NAD(P)-dependent dehydrogenase (short-subunit alcohol dehydrogenase family)
VTVNAVCPGWVDTQMLDEAVEAVMEATGRTREEARAALLAGNPRGRAATPDEVADAVLLLAGNPAVNGQCILIDGGEVQR